MRKTSSSSNARSTHSFSARADVEVAAERLLDDDASAAVDARRRTRPLITSSNTLGGTARYASGCFASPIVSRSRRYVSSSSYSPRT